MPTPRHEDRKRTRRPGAGRPRKIPRHSQQPVAEEIIAEASHLFARHGVANTTMADIAAASGLAVSSVYYYFRSRDDVLERIVAEVNQVPLGILSAARERHDQPAVQLHAFVRADVATVCQFPFDINEIHRLAGEQHESFARYWNERRELEAGVTELVAAGVEAGQLIEISPRLAALTILANDEATRTWYRPPGPHHDADVTERSLDPDEVGAFAADLTLRGLLAQVSTLASISQATSRKS